MIRDFRVDFDIDTSVLENIIEGVVVFGATWCYYSKKGSLYLYFDEIDK